MQQLFLAAYCTLALLLTSCWKSTEGIPLENQTSMAAPLIQPNNSTSSSLTDVNSPCFTFTTGISKMEFSSPNYPNNYPNEMDCVKVIDAGPGNAVLVQFVDTFHIEISEDGQCLYDYLEIRDGKFGYSPVKDKSACGTQPPTRVQSSGQFLWLRFHSDDSIGYKGFRAFVVFLQGAAVKEHVGECYFEMNKIEGEIDSDELIHNDTLLQALHSQKHIDCTWVISADEGKRIFLQIPVYELERPNDCTYNKIEIYQSTTELEGRSGNPLELCGSKADAIKSKDNILAIRLQTLVTSKSLADSKKKLSKFVANFTIYRDLSMSSKSSEENVCIKEEGDAQEFDCQDNACINHTLRCNGKINCQLRNDEEKCPDLKPQGLTADIFIIAFLGCILVSGMCGGMVLNIYRKLKQDKEELTELREALRKSRESGIQSERHISLNDQREPSQGSHTSKETVIERSNPTLPKVKPNGDVVNFRMVNVEVLPSASPAPQTVVVATAPPPWYGRPAAIMKRRSSSSDIKPSSSQSPSPLPPSPLPPSPLPPSPLLPSPLAIEAPPQTCIEVRDCSCQTRDSFLSRLNLGRTYPTRRAPLALDEDSPVRRVSFPYFGYAASSASSETGRSLERLDECSE